MPWIAAAASSLIVCIAWVFWDVIRAQSSLINEAGPADTRPLAPGNVLQRVAYGWSVDALILVGGILWFGLIRARRRRGLPALDATAVSHQVDELEAGTEYCFAVIAVGPEGAADSRPTEHQCVTTAAPSALAAPEALVLTPAGGP